MITSKKYVDEDSQGVLRVGSLGVSLDSVVIAFQQGHSAETIHQLYPALSLEDVYGAIAYYLANRDEVDQYLQRQEQLWDHVRQLRLGESKPSGATTPRAQQGSGLNDTMSRPRFLADNDLNDAIVVGVGRREPAAEFARLRDIGLATRTDPEVLEFASGENWIVVSHDVNTMREVASARVAAGLPMNGLLLAHQHTPVSPIIDSLLLIWAASEAEEWTGQVNFLPL